MFETQPPITTYKPRGADNNLKQSLRSKSLANVRRRHKPISLKQL